jgi:hypothetical protein
MSDLLCDRVNYDVSRHPTYTVNTLYASTHRNIGSVQTERMS